MWHRVERLGEVTSTNDVALRWWHEGVAPGLVVVADHQTAGRGRAGRRWEDRRGGSLLASFLLAAPGRDATLVPLAAGLAVVDAIAGAGVMADLEWPNDVLIGGDKCAGILVERHARAPAEAAVVVVGIGANLDWRGVTRDGRTGGWTSVAEHAGGDVDPERVLQQMMTALAARTGQLERDPARLLDDYRARCVTLGGAVELRLPDGSRLVGHARDVDATGRLVVRSGGRDRHVDAGDVATAARGA